jgi:hypothetical protein
LGYGTKQEAERIVIEHRYDNVENSSLRILSLPGKDFGGNPYIKHFCESLEKAGYGK